MIILITSLISVAVTQLIDQNLNASNDGNLLLLDWKFREASNTSFWHPWYRANVPSTVHLDLMDAERIQDPYLGLNQLQMYELENKDWEYQMTFIADPNILNKDTKRLIFEGLDTHADVYLNDQLVHILYHHDRSYKQIICIELG